ncbi:MAG: TAXI family TRAP transporter solute-binding subunit [Clostridiales bacterium]
MKKKLMALILISVFMLSLSACGGNGSSAPTAAPTQPAAPSEPASAGDSDPVFNNVKVSAGSGTAGGGQYVYVGGITNIINTNLPGVEVILEATKGSGENLVLLQNGEMDIASIESSIAYNAYIGENLAEGEEAFPEVRSLFASLPTHFIITTLDQSASNVEDFAGKIVAFGPYTGSTDISSRAVFGPQGLNLIESFTVTNAGWGDCFTSMADGQVYAVTGGSIHPASAITELEATKKVNFVRFTKEQMDTLTTNFPYYKKVSLPADMYNGLTEEYETIGAWQAMYAHSSMDDDLAYMITKTVFEHINVLQSTHNGGYTTTLENIGEQPVPLHMGAYRYYQEMGIDVPAALLPPELNK